MYYTQCALPDDGLRRPRLYNIILLVIILTPTIDDCCRRCSCRRAGKSVISTPDRQTNVFIHALRVYIYYVLLYYAQCIHTPYTHTDDLCRNSPEVKYIL